MFVVDTNILLYAANADAEEHPACYKLLNNWRRQAVPWYLTWGILYEFLRVATHPAVLPKPFTSAHAWRFLDALLASPSLRLLTETRRHPEILAETLAAAPALRGNLLFDIHTVVLMREHGIRTICTHDADFRRFPDIEVMDPL